MKKNSKEAVETEYRKKTTIHNVSPYLSRQTGNELIERYYQIDRKALHSRQAMATFLIVKLLRCVRFIRGLIIFAFEKRFRKKNAVWKMKHVA